MDKNIILTGMPGVGKSTIGVLLAKRMGCGFVDTDLYIQTRQKMMLQEILDTIGLDEFIRLEEEVILSLVCETSVIATGGSVVYGSRAMAYLKSLGTVIHLDLAPELLIKRIDNIDSRGIAMAKDKTIAHLYSERLPLYEKYRDIKIDTTGKTPEQVANIIVTGEAIEMKL